MDVPHNLVPSLYLFMFSKVIAVVRILDPMSILYLFVSAAPFAAASMIKVFSFSFSTTSLGR